MRFQKAHGTKNDFVIIDDVDDALALSADQVAAICDRRAGIGADGVLRVVRSSAHPELFFMDYRNADGSIAEMCGNGARVFAAHLVRTGLESGPEFAIDTRAGVLGVRMEPDGTVSVEMGRATPIQTSNVPLVTVAGALKPAVAVAAPNPHAVVFVDDVEQAGELLQAPQIAPADAFPEGANVEFVKPLATGHIRMRVYERGVGETASCGTGACAAAWAHLGEAHGTVQVDVPGGTVWVTRRDDDSLVLRGPVEFVASGELSL